MLRTNIRLKKGQVAMEFLVLVGIAFFTFLTLMGIIFYHTEKLREEKEKEDLVGLSLMVQNEINSASTVKDGYIRQFKLPESINNKEYTISEENNKIYFKTRKYEAHVAVPEYQGSLNIGTNIIKKAGGIVYLNQ